MVYQFWIDRLVSYWNPLEALDLKPKQLEDLTKVRPVRNFSLFAGRGSRYHRGRIKFFISELEAGKELDPIHVDNYADFLPVFPVPAGVVDGNHRLIAYMMVGRTTVPTLYTGTRQDVKRYLLGQRKTPPKMRGK